MFFVITTLLADSTSPVSAGLMVLLRLPVAGQGEEAQPRAVAAEEVAVAVVAARPQLAAEVEAVVAAEQPAQVAEVVSQWGAAQSRQRVRSVSMTMRSL